MQNSDVFKLDIKKTPIYYITFHSGCKNRTPTQRREQKTVQCLIYLTYMKLVTMVTMALN